MNKQQKHDFEILKGLGMSEQTAACLIRIAGNLDPSAYAEPKKAGYITSMERGDFPIRLDAALEYLGFYALQPVILGEVLGWCSGFAREFGPYIPNFGLKNKDHLFILAVPYSRWFNHDEHLIAYAPYGCKDYSSEDGWQFSGDHGFLFINTDPYYNLNPCKGKDTIIFQTDIDPLMELYRYAGIYKHFEHGAKLGAVANFLRSELAYQNLRDARGDRALNEFISVPGEPFMLPPEKARKSK